VRGRGETYSSSAITRRIEANIIKPHDIAPTPPLTTTSSSTHIHTHTHSHAHPLASLPALSSSLSRARAACASLPLLLVPSAPLRRSLHASSSLACTYTTLTFTNRPSHPVVRTANRNERRAPSFVGWDVRCAARTTCVDEHHCGVECKLMQKNIAVRVGARTQDLLLRRQALYPLSYTDMH
jgi:hypothetical protein